MPFMANKEVLDIGCGRSNHLDIYSNPNMNVTGIDLRRDVIRGRTDGVFAQADGHNLPFADSSFDEIYILSSLEHVACPNVVLQEANRTLKPGGKIIVDVPHPRYEKIMGLIANDLEYEDGMHRNVFQPSEIETLMKNTGFQIQEFSPRMWKSAVVLTGRWLWAKVTNRLKFDGDTGELCLLPPEKETKFRTFIDRMLWLSENKQASPKRYTLLSPLRFFNRIYPWVTYIEATKPS
jgi:SAM-dependent methyltransferase